MTLFCFRHAQENASAFFIAFARRQIAKVLTFLHQKQKVTIGPMRHSADGLATKATGRKEAS